MAIIIVCFCLPFIFDLSSIIITLIGNDRIDLSNAKAYYLAKLGNGAIGILISGFVFVKIIRASNREKILNRGNNYHNHSYVWYWFCAKILNYGKCNLIRVPIYMQYKVVLNDVFDSYPFDDNYFPNEEEHNETIEYFNSEESTIEEEYNLILEDTYKIDIEQLPVTKRELPTTKIIRNVNGTEGVRIYNLKFVEAVSGEVRKFPTGAIINVFSTMNPKHVAEVAKKVFSLADRGNVQSVNIYQQEAVGKRIFSKFYKII